MVGRLQNIKLLRKEKKITQVQLADILSTSQQVITAYEREIAKPDPDKLPEIAKALDVTIDVLFEPELRLLKKSARSEGPRKNSRLSKIQMVYDKLPASTQRLILKQIESVAQGN